jgi:hypothetical protein
MFDFSSSSSRTLRIAVEPYPVLVLPTVSLGISLTITPRILFPFPMKGKRILPTHFGPFLGRTLCSSPFLMLGFPKRLYFFIMVRGCPVSITSGSPGSTSPASQSLVTDFSCRNYHFVPYMLFSGAGGWRNCRLPSFKSGVHIILIMDWFRLPKMDDPWNAFTLVSRIRPWARGPRVYSLSMVGICPFGYHADNNNSPPLISVECYTFKPLNLYMLIP